MRSVVIRETPLRGGEGEKGAKRQAPRPLIRLLIQLESGILEAGEGYDTRDAGLAANQSPGEAADYAALVGELIDVAAQALSVNALIGLAEQLDVHGLILLGARDTSPAESCHTSPACTCRT